MLNTLIKYIYIKFSPLPRCKIKKTQLKGCIIFIIRLGDLKGKDTS